IIQMKTADTDVSQDAEHIVRNSLPAKDLVERLNFAVQGESDGTIHPVSVNDAVEKAFEAARPRWKDGPEAEGIAIQVRVDLGDVVQVRGTPTGLYDIVINLLFNAVDALPEGGEIRIQTANSDRGARLTVSDCGVGMDEETCRRVFEPFFTTKANVGTGLGLSTVHTILTRWGGGIDVESAPDRGTTFTIHLPAWEGPTTGPDEGVEKEEKRRGRVLVVEDEEVVCQVLTDLLSDDYDVRVVMRGKEAVEDFVPGQWDVALIDLGMPEMPGDRVAETIRAADSLVATVLITGWKLEPDDPRVSVFDFRLQKPFAPVEQVAETVQQAMRLHDDRAQRQG
ncbi:MAG: hybrid sensor histidine kinase/response regulator, partial [Candidatus Latescibacteria bacterium]|nr:hybrid sensor histidine kinase/response regulator [Candidatus Latescibacterota bacterium]